MDALLAELAAIVGPEHVLTDPDVTAGYTTDWTRRFGGQARCVIRPAGTGEVAAVLPTLTVLAGMPGIEAAAALQAEIRALLPGVRAAEYFEAPGLALVRAHTGLSAPLGRDYPAYLLVDAAATEDEAERIVVLAPLQDAAVAMDTQARAGLWAYRERHTESISAAGIPHKLDVALPLGRLAAFRAELDEVIAKADARAIVFGHIGAGNLHVNVLGPAADDDAVDDAVLRLAAGHGGTISAEHGIGRAKAALLHLSRSAAEIEAMRAVKSAFDPAGLLNPGVLFAPS
jgi:FAD/FMN-containing dehydrogenase